MLGRGVKRKAPCDDDDELDEEEEGGGWWGGLHAGLQACPVAVSRQAVLDLSLRKLHAPLRRRSEPCLRRALLIANTLRHIHDEGRRDAAPAAHSAATQTTTTTTTATTAIPAATGATSVAPHPARTPDGDDEKLESLSAAIAAVLKDLEFVEDSTGQPCDAAVLVPPPPPPSLQQQYQHQQQQRMDALFGVAAVAAAGGGGAATGFLTELALEDIFWEPDAIVDMWGLARGAAAVAAAAVAAPFSVAALDEGAGSRPFAGGVSTAQPSPPQQPQPCRVDADIGDLSLEVMVRS